MAGHVEYHIAIAEQIEARAAMLFGQVERGEKTDLVLRTAYRDLAEAAKVRVIAAAQHLADVESAEYLSAVDEFCAWSAAHVAHERAKIAELEAAHRAIAEEMRK